MLELIEFKIELSKEKETAESLGNEKKENGYDK